MKQFLYLMAVLTVLIPMIMFFNDYAINNVHVDTVKRDANEAASAAVLLFDEEKYSEGIWEFHDDEILRYVDKMYRNKYHVTLGIYDFSKGFRKYDNLTRGEELTRTSEESPNIGSFVFNDGKLKTNLEASCIIVILESRVKGFKGLKTEKSIVRYSMYEIQEPSRGMSFS